MRLAGIHFLFDPPAAYQVIHVVLKGYVLHMLQQRRIHCGGLGWPVVLWLSLAFLLPLCPALASLRTLGSSHPQLMALWFLHPLPPACEESCPVNYITS